MMNKEYIKCAKHYLRLHASNEVLKTMTEVIDHLVDDYKRTLKRFDALLKIEGINSKMMVRNDIQYALKEIGDE